MQNPTLTIIVPIYNVENYLIKCIDSILAQSFTDWELLLIDDGSNDNSGTICERIAEIDKRVRVFHKENGGVSSARNLGIKESRGEWVTFIDSDDFVGDSFLLGLFQPLLEGNQVDFVHGGCTNFEGGQTTTINQKYDYYLGDNKGRLFSSFRGLVVSKLFKKTILRDKKIIFDEGMKIAEDMAFTLDYLAFVGNYAFVPECSYYYRRDNENSATHHSGWPSFHQSQYDFIHLYTSTTNYICKYNLTFSDSILRYKQRAIQYFLMLRTMYHDKNIGKHMRIQILNDESKAGNFKLLLYINKESADYYTSHLLINNKIKQFDRIQSIIEFKVKIKEYIKRILNRYK